MTRYSPAGLLFNRYQPRSAWPAALRDIVVVLVERLVVAPRRGPGMCGCRGVAQIEVARAQCGGPKFVLTQSLQLSCYLLANSEGLVLGCIEAWKALDEIYQICVLWERTFAPLRPQHFNKFPPRILSEVHEF